MAGSAIRRKFIRNQLDPEVADPSHQYTTPTVIPIDTANPLDPHCKNTRDDWHRDSVAWDLSAGERIGTTVYTNDHGGAYLPSGPNVCLFDNQQLCWPPSSDALLDGPYGSSRGAWNGVRSYTSTDGDGAYDTVSYFNNRGMVEHAFATGEVWHGPVVGVCGGTLYAIVTTVSMSSNSQLFGGSPPLVAFYPPWPVHHRIQSSYEPLFYGRGHSIYGTSMLCEVPPGDTDWVPVAVLPGTARVHSGTSGSGGCTGVNAFGAIPRDENSFYIYTGSGVSGSYNAPEDQGIWLVSGGSPSKVADLSAPITSPCVDRDGVFWWVQTDPQGSGPGPLMNTSGGSLATPTDGVSFYQVSSGAPEYEGVMAFARVTDDFSDTSNWHATGGASITVTPSHCGGASNSFPSPVAGENWDTGGDANVWGFNSTWYDSLSTDEPFATVYVEKTSTFQVWLQVEADIEDATPGVPITGVGSDYMPIPAVIWNEVSPVIDEETGLITGFNTKENRTGTDYMNRVADNDFFHGTYFASNEYEEHEVRGSSSQYDTPVHPTATGDGNTLTTDLYTGEVIIDPGWYQLTAKVKSQRLHGTAYVRGFYILQGEENAAVAWTPPEARIGDNQKIVDESQVTGGSPSTANPVFAGDYGVDWF